MADGAGETREIVCQDLLANKTSENSESIVRIHANYVLKFGTYIKFFIIINFSYYWVVLVRYLTSTAHYFLYINFVIYILVIVVQIHAYHTLIFYKRKM